MMEARFAGRVTFRIVVGRRAPQAQEASRVRRVIEAADAGAEITTRDVKRKDLPARYVMSNKFDAEVLTGILAEFEKSGEVAARL